MESLCPLNHPGWFHALTGPSQYRCSWTSTLRTCSSSSFDSQKLVSPRHWLTISMGTYLYLWDQHGILWLPKGKVGPRQKKLKSSCKTSALQHYNIPTSRFLNPAREKESSSLWELYSKNNIRIMKEHIIIQSNLTHSGHCSCFVSRKWYPQAGEFWVSLYEVTKHYGQKWP